MNRRLLTILLLAFVIASACGFLVWRLVGKQLNATKTVPSTHVVAAASDIKLGSVLTAANLTTIEITGALPKGALLRPENAIGRGVLSDLYAGEPIIEGRLAAVGSGGGLAATIPQGMRAAAVKVDEVVGVSGFATPGMRVDVIISGNPPDAQARNEQTGVLTKTLLQNIQVLSAGQDIQKDAEGKAHPVQVVNLLVTPEDAETLSLASNQTKIQLVLRNPLDTAINKIQGTDQANLFADQMAPIKIAHAAPKKVVPKAPPAFSIEVINGSKRSETKFGTPGGPQ
jgi:pilus assembly protein CpaB